MDAANCRVAEANLSSFGSRCRLIHGAAWFKDAVVSYERRSGIEDGFTIHGEGPTVDSGHASVRAISMPTLMREQSLAAIDYLKMDIEGAEKELLQNNTDWLSRVRCLKVELHGDYSITQCAADLSRAGFSTSVDTHHNQCVVAIRE